MFAQLVLVAFFSGVGVEHQDEVLHGRLQLGRHFCLRFPKKITGKMGGGGEEGSDELG